MPLGFSRPCSLSEQLVGANSLSARVFENAFNSTVVLERLWLGVEFEASLHCLHSPGVPVPLIFVPFPPRILPHPSVPSFSPSLISCGCCHKPGD